MEFFSDEFRHEAIIKTTPYGRFLVNDDLVCKEVGAGGFVDPYLQPIFDKFIDSESIVLDVGAHCGFHSVYFSKIAKGVFAFEPQRHVFHQLCGNLFLNNCFNVSPLNLALSDIECRMTVLLPHDHVAWGGDRYINYDECGNSGSLSVCKNPNGTIQGVFIDKFNFEKVDFIKIDAQGAEMDILMGGFKTITECRPYFTFEYSWVVGIYEHGIKKLINYIRSQLKYEVLCLSREKFEFLAIPGEKADEVLKQFIYHWDAKGRFFVLNGS